MKKENRALDIVFKQVVFSGIFGEHRRFSFAHERKCTEVIPKENRNCYLFSPGSQRLITE